MAIKLGDLLIRLTGDSTSFEKMVDDAERKLTKVSKRLTAAGKKMSVAFTAPLAAIAAVSVKTFADFDDAMTKSTAIMGDLSAETRQAMEDTARDISRKGVKSATELAEAYFFLASAGFDAEQSMLALGKVANFATAGTFDMAQATDLLTDAQSALGLASDDNEENIRNMIRLSDVLVGANSLANTSTEQVAKALVTKSAGAFKNLSRDVEEAVAILGVFADAGIKGEQGGEKLAIVIRDLQNAASKNSKEWEKMGLTVFDANEKLRPIADIVGDLTAKFDTMTDKQKKVSATMLGFQDRSFSAIQTLLGTSAKIREYQKDLQDMQGITDEVTRKQLTSFSAQMKILKNNIDDVAITIGSTLAPIITQVGKWVKAATDEWRKWDKATQKLIVGVGALVALIGPFLITLGTLVAIAKAVGFAIFGGMVLGFIKFLALSTLVVTAVLLVADTILEMTDTASLGINNLVQDFRIGGSKISTWMTAAWLIIFQAFEEARIGMQEGWLVWKTTMLDLAGVVKRKMIEAARDVMNAWEKAKNIATFGFVDNNFKLNIVANNKFFDEQIADSLDSAEKRNKDFYDSITDMENELADLRKANADAIAETFAKDDREVERRRKKRKDRKEEDKKDPTDVEEPNAPESAARREASRIAKGQFKEVNLKRFALLSGSEFGDRKKKKQEVQKVENKEVENKLDTLIKVTRENTPKLAILG